MIAHVLPSSANDTPDAAVIGVWTTVAGTAPVPAAMPPARVSTPIPMIVLTSDAVVASSELAGRRREPPRGARCVVGTVNLASVAANFASCSARPRSPASCGAGNCGVVHVDAAAKAASARTIAYREVESRGL